MSTALVCTGVQFPDSTIQTSAAVSINTITYANRSNLRTTTPSANLTAIAVEDLGIFTYYANNTEPDDDESCFVVSGSGGAWRLLTPSWDMIYGNMSTDIEYLTNCVGCLNLLISGAGGSTVASTSANTPKLNLFATCRGQLPFCCIGTDNIANWTYFIPGVCCGDIVHSQPINWQYYSMAGSSCGCGPVGPTCGVPIPYFTSVPCANYVMITLMNPWTSALVPPFCGTSTCWAVYVLRCC